MKNAIYLTADDAAGMADISDRLNSYFQDSGIEVLEKASKSAVTGTMTKDSRKANEIELSFPDGSTDTLHIHRAPQAIVSYFKRADDFAALEAMTKSMGNAEQAAIDAKKANLKAAFDKARASDSVVIERPADTAPDKVVVEDKGKK